MLSNRIKPQFIKHRLRLKLQLAVQLSLQVQQQNIIRFSHRDTRVREGGGERWGGVSGCDTEKEGEGKRKRHSMIMYELSAVLHGEGKSAVVHLKRRLSCQDTAKPR